MLPFILRVYARKHENQLKLTKFLVTEFLEQRFFEQLYVQRRETKKKEVRLAINVSFIKALGSKSLPVPVNWLQIFLMMYR